MIRKLIGLLVLVGVGISQGANALGLGEMRLVSALNEPLRAEIQLKSVGDLSDSQIRVQLASKEDFEKAGVDRQLFLNNLRFSIKLGNNKAPDVIVVTTAQPVREPYLDFVVELRWPTGRLLREYTALLDLPVFTNEAPVAVAAPYRQKPTSDRSAGKTASSVSESEVAATIPTKTFPSEQPSEKVVATADKPDAKPATASSTTATDLSEYGPTSRNDTLWGIAMKVRADRSLSIQQTMLALQRLNPDAFLNNNINLLKTGKILRVPTAQEVQDMAFPNAYQEVAAQNRQWRQDEPVAAQLPQLDARTTEPQQTVAPESEVEGHLVLAAAAGAQAKQTPSGAGGEEKGSASASGSAAATEEELAASLENIEKIKRENEELDSRLKDMTEQLATLQKLITLKDEELAALQAAAISRGDDDGTKQPEPVDPAATVVAEAAVTEAGNAGSSDATSSQADTQANAQPEAQAQAETEAEVPAQTEAEAQAGIQAQAQAEAETPASQFPLLDMLPSGLRDVLAKNLYLAVAAVVSALLMLLLVMRRKARRNEFDSDVFDSEDAISSPNDVYLEGKRLIAATAETGDKPASSLFSKPLPPGLDEEKEALRQQIHDQSNNVIGEADIFIAYGRHQQAIYLLLNAIEEQPRRVDYRLKLLEVYADINDQAGFNAQYDELLGLNDLSAMESVRQLLRVAGLSHWLDEKEGLSARMTNEVDSGQSFDELAVSFQESRAAEAEEEEEEKTDNLAGDADKAAAVDTDLSVELGLDNYDLANLQQDLMAEDLNLDLNQDLNNTAEDRDFLLESRLGLDDIEEDQGLALESELGLHDTGVDRFPEQELSLDDVDEDRLQENELDLSSELMNLHDDDAASAIEEISFSEALAVPETDTAESVPDLSEVAAETSVQEEALEEIFQENTDESAISLLSDSDTNNFEQISGDNFWGKPSAKRENTATIHDFPTELRNYKETDVVDDDDLLKSDLELLGDADEVATKLDLARAYIDMGDTKGARDILEEVLQEGETTQKDEAIALLSRIA